mmetsp:Transcript_17107/g.47026  ORF Transcript_17107/g.47026 Transcript_17107/m.47026 type:complete len:464 (+) Transcript_17107:222-1613(+)
MTAQALRRCRRFQQRQSLPSLNLGGDITTSSKGGFRADNAGIQYYQNHNQKQHRSQQHRNRCTIAPFYRSSLSSTTAALGEGSFSASLSSSSSSLADTNRDRISDSNLSVRKIIMLDKDPKLRWDHVDATNNDRDPITNDNRNHHHHHHSPRRPFIECWPNFNLHEIDEVVDRLSQQLQLSQDAATPETNAEDGKEEEEEEPPVPVGETVISQLAVVGIHLCKTLSPTCIGIVNALGPERCPCLVLAPCCLPRVVVRSKNNHNHNPNPNHNHNPSTQNQNSNKAALLEVRRYETPDELRLRREAKQRRDAAMVRGRVGGGVGSGSRSARPRAMGDQVRLLHPDADADGGAIAIPSGACWKCGEFGHRKKDCPSDQTTGKPKLIPPACVQLDVSDIIPGEERPFRAYCDKLATTIQRDSVTIRETSIENEHYKKIREDQQHQKSGQQLEPGTKIHFYRGCEYSC